MRFNLSLMAFLYLFAAVLSGCVGLQPARFVSSVDSLAQTDAFKKKRYLLLPGQKGIEVNDLQFREFAEYVDKAMGERGFEKATDFQNADIAVFLTYAIGDPQTYQYTYSTPTWGQTGVSASNTSGSVSSYGGTTNYSGTTRYTPTYGITGSQTHIATSTMFTKFVLLDAYDIQTYATQQRMEQVWKTTAVNVDSSGDLRLVFPYMIVAMKPYFGVSTGKKIDVKVPVNDPAVLLLRTNSLPNHK